MYMGGAINGMLDDEKFCGRMDGWMVEGIVQIVGWMDGRVNGLIYYFAFSK